MLYANTKKAGELLGRSGLQLPRLPSLNTDRILTKKNLAGYRKVNNPLASFAGRNAATADTHALAVLVSRSVSTEIAGTQVGTHQSRVGDCQQKVSDLVSAVR